MTSSSGAAPLAGPAAPNEWRRGYSVVVAAALGYGTGGAMILLTAGLFILPMRQALGWSTRAVAISPIVSLVMALAAPFAGRLIDRIGSRSAAIGGTLALGILAALLAIAPIGATALYGFAVLMGLAASLTIVPTYTRAVATWFPGGPGLAFGVTLSGSALVSIVALPAIGTAIEAYGWRAGYLAIAAILMLVGLPAVLFGYRERVVILPVVADAEHIDGSTLAEAFRTPRFWAYLLTLGIACFGTGGFTAHLQPLLVSQGLSVREAIGVGVAFALAMSVGKIAGGMLLDRAWPFAVAAGLMALAGIGAFTMTWVNGPATVPLATISACLLGLGQGSEADFVAFFGLRAFGMRAYSAILGVFALATTMMLSAVAFTFAWIVDVYGNYRFGCYLGAAALMTASALFLLIGWSETERSRDPIDASFAEG
jgi:predicted MFS family arabinose efflux permease